MRSLPELQAEAIAAGFDPTGLKRVEIMDLLRGEADEMQVDPMKAYDLKKEIHWGEEDAFRDIARYLTADRVLEPKYDGCRMRLFIGVDGSRMNTGRRSLKTKAYIERSDNFPHLAGIRSKKYAGTVLDGELMAPRPDIPTRKGGLTKSMLNAAVALVNVDPAHAVAVQREVGWCTYWVFDIIKYKGEDVRHLPYIERRKLVAKVLAKKGTKHFQSTPMLKPTEAAIRWCLRMGYEGSMLKTRSGSYHSGKRSREWYKVKTMSTLDVVITGFTEGEGRNEGKVGGVKVSLVKDTKKGLKLVEVGRFGAMDDSLRQAMTDDFDNFEGQVVEITAQGKTIHGRLRHPQLVRFRPDKYPVDCGLDQLDHIPEV